MDISRFDVVDAFARKRNVEENNEWGWAASIDHNGLVSLSCESLNGSGYKPTLALPVDGNTEWMYGEETLNTFVNVDKIYMVFVVISRSLRKTLYKHGMSMASLRIS